MKQLQKHSYINSKAIVFQHNDDFWKPMRKVCMNVKYVMDALRQDDAHEQLHVLRLQIDYELATLHDAIQANDNVAIIKSKQKLENLRQRWLQLEGNE